MVKRLAKAIVSSFRLPRYKLSYYLGSWLDYLHCCLRGLSTPSARLHHYQSIHASEAFAQSSTRVAIFVAYHPGKSLPVSNQLYLQSLLEVGFSIIYVHNGPLAIETQQQLALYCNRIFCRYNIGQDFGAWKDCFLYCQSLGMLEGLEWLLMCNDSNYFLGGENASAFQVSFQSALSNPATQLIALNKNYELWAHFQSYFLCYHHSLFKDSRFLTFWAAYKPLSHRYHAINHGEIALTRRLLNSTDAAILYDSTSLTRVFSSALPASTEFFKLLPMNAMYLADERCGELIDPFRLQQILSLLDLHNPSHAYALLFPYYLKSPFLKKDIFRQGVCSLPQVVSLLHELGYSQHSSLYTEVIADLQKSGMHTSYIRYPRDSFRKGINAIEGAVFQGYGRSLSSFGLRD